MKQSFKHSVLLYSLFIGLACLATTMPLRAEVSLYIVAPGDTLWSIANANLKSPHDWKKLMEFNDLSDQSQLQVDQALRIPSEWMKDSITPETNTTAQPGGLPPEAVVPAQDERSPAATRESAKAVENTASLTHGNNKVAAIYGLVELVKNKSSNKLALNARIAANSRIRTGNNSSVNIVLENGSMLVLLSNTEIELSQPIQLLNGELEYSVNTAQERPLISTMAGSVSAQTAHFRIAAKNDGKQMRVEVEQGEVLVSNKNKQRRISMGIAMQLIAGNEMVEPRQGPMRPDLANLSKSSVNGEAHLKWQAINGASAYRAQLVYAADNYLVLFDEHLNEAQLDWRNISPGHYKFRLRSVDEKGLEGLNAELPFFVQGALSPPRSNSPLNGATLPTDTPWIAWSRVPEANSYVLQVAQDAGFKTGLQELGYQINNYYKFSEALPAGEYYWRVQSASTKGAKSPFGEVRMFRIKP